MDDRHLGRAAALARERAPAHVAQPPADHVRRVDVDDEQRLLEARARARAPRPRRRARREWPSKISSSWPPTALQNATKHALSRARVTSISSRSRSLPTWNGDAEMFDDQLRAGEREVGRGRARLPDVLADRRPDERLAELEQERSWPGAK